MPRGRPPSQHAPEEKAAIRREKVRLNVKAHRERQKRKGLASKNQSKFRWVYETKWENRGEKQSQSQDKRKLAGGASSAGDESNLARLQLLHAPSSEKVSADALLASFRTQFLPDTVTLPTPKARLATPCASWVIQAFDLSALQEKAPLSSMLRSVALGLMGAERERKDIQLHSLNSYRRTLAAVGRQVQSLIDGGSYCVYDTTSLLLSCHVAAMFELMVNGSLPDMFRHIRGLGSLLLHQIRTLAAVPQVLCDLVQEYRLLEICFCINYRQLSVLEGLNRDMMKARNLKGSDSAETPSYMQSLLDIGHCIPPVMVRLDNLESRNGPRTFMQRFQEIINTLDNIIEELEKWSSEFLTGCGASVQGFEFWFPNSNSMDFPSLDVATVWTFSLSFKIHALETYISAINVCMSSESASLTSSGWSLDAKVPQTKFGSKSISQGRREILTAAHLLSRSLPYFFKANVGVIGRSLSVFPLESARLALANELERCLSPDPHGESHHDSNLMHQRSQEIVKALSICKSSGLKAKESGLPLFSENWSSGHIPASSHCVRSGARR